MTRKETPKNQAFANRLLDLYEKSGIKGREPRAKIIGVHPSSYDNYVKEGRVPEWDILTRIAECFNVSVDWLLTGKEPSQAECPAGQALIRLPRGDPDPLHPHHADLLEKALVVLRAGGDASHFAKSLENNIDSFHKGVQQANYSKGLPGAKTANKAH